MSSEATSLVYRFSQARGISFWTLFVLADGYVNGDDPRSGRAPDLEQLAPHVRIGVRHLEAVIDSLVQAGELEWRPPKFYLKLGNWQATSPRIPKPERTPTRATPGYIYLLQLGEHYKIGRTNNLENRLDTFSVKMPVPPTLLHHIYVRDMNTAERRLHELFADKRLNGEWFALNDDDITLIKSIPVEELT